jgi:catechol-2,3-dioxygenase
VLELAETKTGRATSVLHTFYALGDGSFLAFFEAPDQPFTFKHQHDYDLHIALEVPYEELASMLEKGKQAGIESRGPSDHDFIHSVYFRDPNGYAIELTAKLPHHDREVDPSLNGAREKLARWQAKKQSA